MSYAYPYRRAIVPARRPRGVTVLATIGLLGGVAEAVLAIVAVWLRMRQGLAFASQASGLAIGLAIGLATLWIAWGLWDRMRWAWWANLVTGTVAIVVLGFLLRYAPALAGLLARGQPPQAIARVTIGLFAVIGAGIAFNLGAVIYLLRVRAAFGLGVRERRPLWERG